MTGCFFVIAFVLALRGNEVFMVEASGLVGHFHYGLEQLEEEVKGQKKFVEEKEAKLAELEKGDR